MTDLHKNFAYSLVATAPSPPTSGTSIVVSAGQGALFPVPPFNATVWPAGTQPLASNAEIVRITNLVSDTLTAARTQEGTPARTIGIGDQIAATITAKTLTDAETEPFIDLSDSSWGLVFDDATDNATAYNAMLAAVPDKSLLFHPKGGLAIAGSITVPSGKHLTFQGAGADKTWFRISHQTVDMFVLSDWQQTFVGISFYVKSTTTTGVQTLPTTPINITDATQLSATGTVMIATTTGWQTVTYTGKSGNTLTGASGGTGNTSAGGIVINRSAGYAINAGSMSYIFIDQCGFTNQFNGVLMNATLTGIRNTNFAGTVNFDMQFNGTNVNGYIDNVTCDGLPQALAHIEMNQGGSLIISNSDLIRGQNNLRINPTSPNGCFSVYCSNVFFDTASGSSVKLMGTGNIQRMKFANCWLSGSVNGLECNSTAGTLPTAIDLINCDIYSNSANGILWTAGQDFAVANCRIAGNATAGINIVAAAGAVTKFNLTNNTIGPTAGIGANGTGILINSGTYGGYIVTGNNVAGNTTSNINDGGSVSGFNQKVVEENIGANRSGLISATTAASAGINTTETVVAGGLNICPVPANSMRVGDSWEITLQGTCTSTVANASTFRVRFGTAGTTADGVLGSAAVTAAASGTTIPFKAVIKFTVRTIGASGTIAGSIAINNTGVTGLSANQSTVVALTPTAINTTVNNYMEATYVAAAATTTSTFQNGIIERL